MRQETNNNINNARGGNKMKRYKIIADNGTKKETIALVSNKKQAREWIKTFSSHKDVTTSAYDTKREITIYTN